VDNYAYDDIEDITIEFDGEEEGDEFIKMDFDLSNEHNAKLDQKAKENFKKTSKRFKDQKAKEKSKKEKPKEEKPKEKEKPKDKELVEKAKKQLAIMNRARDRGIEMDEDMREDLEDIVKGSGLPKSKFDWFM
jgi:leucyl aminopeptidase